MDHGLLQYKNGKTFVVRSGDEMFTGWQCIRLFGAAVYQFQGHKTSILDYLIRHGDKYFAHIAGKSDEHNTPMMRNLMIRGCATRSSTTKEVTNFVQKSAGSVLSAGTGAFLEFADVGYRAVEAAISFGESSHLSERVTEHTKPGTVQTGLDRAFNDKIIIEIGAYFPPPTTPQAYKLVLLEAGEATFSTVADVTRGMP